MGKVNRANAHLNALDREFGTFVNAESKPWGFISCVDPESGEYTLRVRLWKPLPMELSLIVGDFAQNLRAALDHLVWQLVLVNGRRPRRENFFPIFDYRPRPGSRQEKRWNAAIKGLSDNMVTFIDSCQPYARRDEGPHLLMALRNLSNQDKHRVIVSSHGAIKKPGEGFTFAVESRHDVGEIRDGELLVDKALADGDIVARAICGVTGPNPEIKLKGNLAVDIAFGEDPWIAPLGALADLMNVVATIIQQASVNWFDGETLWPQDGP